MPRGHAPFHPLMVFIGARAATQAWLTLTRRRLWRNSRFQPVLKGLHVMQAQVKYRRLLRPWVPSILWNALRGRGIPFEWSRELLNGQCKFWCDRYRRVQSITVLRNEIRWLGDSALLAKLTQSPRHSKWLRSLDLWDRNSALRLSQNEPVAEVIQDVDSRLSQPGKEPRPCTS